MKKGINLDKDIQAGIERNARQGWLEYNLSREREIERRKKERIKERVLAIVVGGFIIAATSLLLILNSKLTQDAKESCMSLGHSESYCMEKL
jgi:hypothetical protein